MHADSLGWVWFGVFFLGDILLAINAAHFFPSRTVGARVSALIQQAAAAAAEERQQQWRRPRRILRAGTGLPGCRRTSSDRQALRPPLPPAMARGGPGRSRARRTASLARRRRHQRPPPAPRTFTGRRCLPLAGPPRHGLCPAAAEPSHSQSPLSPE